jgi:hypothetical protein
MGLTERVAQDDDRECSWLPVAASRSVSIGLAASLAASEGGCQAPPDSHPCLPGLSGGGEGTRTLEPPDCQVAQYRRGPCQIVPYRRVLAGPGGRPGRHPPRRATACDALGRVCWLECWLSVTVEQGPSEAWLSGLGPMLLVRFRSGWRSLERRRRCQPILRRHCPRRVWLRRDPRGRDGHRLSNVMPRAAWSALSVVIDGSLKVVRVGHPTSFAERTPPRFQRADRGGRAGPREKGKKAQGSCKETTCWVYLTHPPRCFGAWVRNPPRGGFLRF